MNRIVCVAGLLLLSLPAVAQLHSTRIQGAGIGAGGLALYGCDSGEVEPGWVRLRVSPTAGADHSSISAALQAAGSTPAVICVAAGDYVDQVDFGTSRRAIVVGGFNEGFSARDPALTPSHLQPLDPALPILRAQSPRRLVIDGLELSGSQRRAIAFSLWDTAPPGNESVEVLNSHVHHNGSQSQGGGSSATGGVSIGGGEFPQVRVAYNVIEHNDGWHHGGGLNIGGGTVNPLVRDGSNDGFGTISQQVDGLAIVEGNLIRNNRLFEPSLPHGAGAAIGMNAIVRRNEFMDNDTVGDGSHYGVGGGLIAQHGVSGDSTNALIHVRDNWFEGNHAGKAGAAVFFDQTHAGWLINNVIVGNIGSGVVLVDGACSDSCEGPAGDHDRNFMTVISNTIADNAGEALRIQDSTAHLYFNVIWNNAPGGEDILLTGGSPGADNQLRGAHNLISTAQTGLLDTLDASGVAGLLDSRYRLLDALVEGQPASTDDPAVLSAFQFSGSLAVDSIDAHDIEGTPRSQPGGRWTYGAYAMPAGDGIFADNFEAAAAPQTRNRP